jgi:hypothetical protein
MSNNNKGGNIRSQSSTATVQSSSRVISSIEGHGTRGGLKFNYQRDIGFPHPSRREAKVRELQLDRTLAVAQWSAVNAKRSLKHRAIQRARIAGSWRDLGAHSDALWCHGCRSTCAVGLLRSSRRFGARRRSRLLAAPSCRPLPFPPRSLCARANCYGLELDSETQLESLKFVHFNDRSSIVGRSTVNRSIGVDFDIGHSRDALVKGSTGAGKRCAKQ